MIVPESNPLPAKTRKQSALKIASRGISLFPCNGKKPLTQNGLKDATTDPRRISMWWKKRPEANIAAPTGANNGFFVLDVDNRTSLEILEAEHGKLPATLASKTGSGGMHLFFKYPSEAGVEVRNSAGKLRAGLDVRGEGGYVVLPPSSTEGAYEWIEKLPIADAPEWLVELVKEKPRNRCGVREVRPKPSLVHGGPIFEGSRNVTLTSIAGCLNDGSRALPELTDELMQINAARCEPPLETDEVTGIAKSIHRLAPCKKGTRFTPPTPEVIGILGNILKDWWWADWRGTGGKSERDVLLVYILFAIESGTILPNGGILVDVSHHQVAERARKSSSTAYNSHKRLSVKGWCRGGGNGPDRREDQPSGIVLLPRSQKQRKPEHPLPGEASLDRVFDFASLPTARRGRHSAPGLVRVASAGRIACIDQMERINAPVPARVIADALGISRAYDVRKRYLEPLEAYGIVERLGKLWGLTEGWQETLEQLFEEEEALERELYSGLTADERQKKRREESRERWRNRENTHPEPAPSENDMRESRDSYPERRREAIKAALARLFREQPEYRGRRVGQTTCRLVSYLSPDFPRGPDGLPKDAEVEAILDGVKAA